MDIASISMAMSQSNVSKNIGIAMLSKSLDNVESTGDAMVTMLEECVDPNRGQNIDLRV